MTQEEIEDIKKAGEFLDNMPVPTRDEKTIGIIIQAHMPIEELISEKEDD